MGVALLRLGRLIARVWAAVKKHRVTLYELAAGVTLILGALTVNRTVAFGAAFVCFLAKALEHGFAGRSGGDT